MPSPAGLSIRSIGFIGAGVLALVFGAIIAISMMNASSAQRGDPSDALPDPDEIIDIEQTQTGGAMFVTMVDQNDPTRVSSTLRADRFEPIGEGRRRLDRPESWIYLKDGRALRVNADTAIMLMPDPNQPPESGTLEGNILIRSYDSTPAPGQPATEGTPPAMTARFDEPLEFERRYLRMRSGGSFLIESERYDFAGSDLTVIYNDLKNRVELIDVLEGDRITIRTPGSGPDSTGTTTQDASPAAPIETGTPQTTAETVPTQTPSTEHYQITLDAGVEARAAGDAVVSADMLTLWTTLVDGTLPDDAVRQITLASDPGDAPTDAPPATSAAGSPAQISDASAASSTDATPSEGLVLTWSGPMRVRPIDGDLPDELSEDLLALRLDSGEGSGITMTAPEHGFSGQAKRLSYYATRGYAELDGEASEQGIVRLGAEDAGTLYAESLRANLATGQIDMPRRGSIATAHADPEQVASVRWKNRARISFAVDERGALTQRLESARFEGAAIAEQGGNSVGARAINATLDPSLEPASALTQIVLEEGVIASADKRTLTGKEVTIDFEPSDEPGASPQPVRLTSIGSSMGRTPDQMLRSDDMHARLVRDAEGRTLVRTARAVGSVRYRDSSRTTATADELNGDGINEVIVLTGDDAQVAQAGSTITGPHITLRAARRSIEVLGAGTFEHDIALSESENARPGQLGRVDARWGDSMVFEDTLGTLECEGDVRVISTPDALTRDTLKADRVSIKMTPVPSESPVANAPRPERRLISARAMGRAAPGQDPVPASIESRTYDPSNPERALGVLYLEGGQILGNNEAQTLTVPGAGTMLILDRQETDPDDADRDQPVDGSGLTRFTWGSRMVLDRGEGRGTFTESVVVDHKSLSSGKRATLNTDELVAFFEMPSADDGEGVATASGSNTLRSAIATGSVRFVYAGSELLSDRGEYDAIADSLFASALEGNRVTLYRNDGSPPTSARTVEWDLGNDRLRINAPSPVRSTTGG